MKILEWTPKRHVFNVLKKDVLKAFLIILGSTMIIISVPIFSIIATLNIVFGIM